ncbi:hypothetical protein AVMA1855_20120 [Acidovorax sp. SUPP1855]|nr:hypothetical protein AVMA1855_20120 [Acidovorax sp. SUPP1855]
MTERLQRLERSLASLQIQTNAFIEGLDPLMCPESLLDQDEKGSAPTTNQGAVIAALDMHAQTVEDIAKILSRAKSRLCVW